MNRVRVTTIRTLTLVWELRTPPCDTHQKESIKDARVRVRGRRYQNPVELAQDVIGGKWKMPILWRLGTRTWRYSELRRDLPAISHKMLTQQLRELERHGLITRTVHAVVPPHVDYDITSLGRTALPAIEVLRAWGAGYRRRRSG
ncbi:MAG: helix-turn-helix domain-containing protein [Vicinamibacterales bacterium]